MNIQDLPEFLTFREVTQILHITRTTLRTWRNLGKIKGINLSIATGDKTPLWRYPKSEILRILQQDRVN